MYALSSCIIGLILAIGFVIFAENHWMALLYAPVIASATVLALGLLPDLRRQ